MVAIISKQGLKQQAIERRIARLNENKVMPAEKKAPMLEMLQTGVIPSPMFAEGVALDKVLRVADGNSGMPKGTVAEFIGTKDFDAAWFQRQRYEIDAGRDNEPLLYPAFYSITVQSDLPQVIKIYTLGNAGVVFVRAVEGGEVEFASINTGTKNVELYHYAVGLEYSEDLFLFNGLWRVANLERQFGIAHNALLNHIHLSPILTYSYAAANQTAGGSLTNFAVTASMPEKYLRAIEAAMQNATLDQANPRRGPYVILCSIADLFTIERALQRVPQQGFDVQSSAIGRIQSIVAYDGWTGTRGAEVTSYAGVSAGTCYLVDVGNKDTDYQSYVKIPLRLRMGNPDVSRFIEAQSIWDTWFGVFADPIRSVEEITLPTPASGAS